MPGYFYGPPPTFIGGRQPYAPKLGSAQSGPDAPPVKSLAVLGIIVAGWAQATPALPPQTRIAPLIPADVVSSQVPINRASLAIIDASWRGDELPHIRGEYFAPTLPVVSQPPPVSRTALWNIDAKWREDIITVISLSSMAPQVEAETADAPPVRDGNNLNLVLRAWEPRALHPQASPKGIVSGPLPDAAPLIYRANFNAIIEQWKPKPYAPPELIGIGAVFQAPVVPDAPPVRTYTVLGSIVRQWPVDWVIPPASEPIAHTFTPDAPPVRTYTVLQSIIGQWPTAWDIPPTVEPIAHTIVVDNPPVPSWINTNLIIDQWKPYALPHLTDKLAAIFYVPPPFVGPTSGQTVTVHVVGSVTVHG